MENNLFPIPYHLHNDSDGSPRLDFWRSIRNVSDVTTTFLSGDAKVVTVTNGIITNVV